MHGLPRTLALLTLSLAPLALSACGAEDRPTDPPAQASAVESDTEDLLRLADAGPATRKAVVAELRARGPEGLDALVEAHRASGDPRLRPLIDEVAQQRDAVYGGLFWERDLEVAKRRAADEGKPILSLRLLGELTSEYSCANSRLFRTVLYADPELADWLESNFVLHWSSERPVPKLEIDYGDGRVVQRTITGNSAHFVLDADGQVLDVLPGLWSPATFQLALTESLSLAVALEEAADDPGARGRTLAADHQRRFEARARQLHAGVGEVRRIAPSPQAVADWLREAPGDVDGDGRIPAAVAVPMAVGKSRMEAPILGAGPRALGGGGGRVQAPGPFTPMDETEQLVIGQRVAKLDALHPNTRAIIRAERPLDELVAAEEREAALTNLEDQLLASIRRDTAKSALELYPRVHAELARRAAAGESLAFADVDAWLYAELFQTPAGDPWLGLVDESIYTGLVDGGVARPTAEAP